MADELGTIAGRTVYGRLDHRGRGRVWLDDGVNNSFTGLVVLHIISSVIGCAFAISLFIAVNGDVWAAIFCLVSFGWQPLPYLSGRYPFCNAVWLVARRRSLFRITLSQALVRISRHVYREDRRNAVKAKQETEARRITEAIQEAMKALP